MILTEVIQILTKLRSKRFYIIVQRVNHITTVVNLLTLFWYVITNWGFSYANIYHVGFMAILA